jgi:uncharacterized membrane protein YfcA
MPVGRCLAGGKTRGRKTIGAIDPLYTLSGFAVGVLVGLTGVGGGSLMTPLLVLLFGVHPATAVGTDLLYASITKAFGTAAHGLNRTVDWRITGLLAAGSVPASAATIYALSMIGHTAELAKTISVFLGYALLATAASLLLRHQIAAYVARHRREERSEKATALLTVATGVVLGAIVTISSVGAGALGVTALLLLYPSLPIKRIVGSDISHAVPLTFVAGVGHWMIGTVAWGLLGSLLIGSVPGIVLGSQLTSRVPEAFLRITLATTLIAVSVKLILG